MLTSTSKPAQDLGGWDVVVAVRLSVCNAALTARLTQRPALYFEAQLSPADPAPYYVRAEVTAGYLLPTDSSRQLCLELHLAGVTVGVKGGAAQSLQQARVRAQVGLRWGYDGPRQYLALDPDAVRPEPPDADLPEEEHYIWQELWARCLAAGVPWDTQPTPLRLLILNLNGSLDPRALPWLRPTAPPQYCLTPAAGGRPEAATLNILLLTEGRRPASLSYHLPDLVPATNEANAAYCCRDGLLLQHLLLATIPTVLPGCDPLLDFTSQDQGRTFVSNKPLLLQPLFLERQAGLSNLDEAPYAAAGDIRLAVANGRLIAHYENVHIRWSETVDLLYSTRLHYTVLTDNGILRVLNLTTSSTRRCFFVRPQPPLTLSDVILDIGQHVVRELVGEWALRRLANWAMPPAWAGAQASTHHEPEAFWVAEGRAEDYLAGQLPQAPLPQALDVTWDQCQAGLNEYSLRQLAVTDTSPRAHVAQWALARLLPRPDVPYHLFGLGLAAHVIVATLHGLLLGNITREVLRAYDYIDLEYGSAPYITRLFMGLAYPESALATELVPNETVVSAQLADGCFQVGLRLSAPPPPTPVDDSRTARENRARAAAAAQAAFEQQQAHKQAQVETVKRGRAQRLHNELRFVTADFGGQLKLHEQRLDAKLLSLVTPLHFLLEQHRDAINKLNALISRVPSERQAATAQALGALHRATRDRIADAAAVRDFVRKAGPAYEFANLLRAEGPRRGDPVSLNSNDLRQLGDFATALKEFLAKAALAPDSAQEATTHVHTLRTHFTSLLDDYHQEMPALHLLDEQLAAEITKINSQHSLVGEQFHHLHQAVVDTYAAQSQVLGDMCDSTLQHAADTQRVYGALLTNGSGVDPQQVSGSHPLNVELVELRKTAQQAVFAHHAGFLERLAAWYIPTAHLPTAIVEYPATTRQAVGAKAKEAADKAHAARQELTTLNAQASGHGDKEIDGWLHKILQAVGLA